MRWSEGIWSALVTCLNVEGSEKWGVKWSEMKSFRGMCVLWLIYTRWFKYDRDKLWLVYTQIVPVIFEPPCSYAVRTWVTEYYVVWFLFCIFCFCYVLITRFMFFIIRFTFVLLSILCVLCFCTVLCIVSPYVYSRFFSICVYWPLPQGGNTTAVMNIMNHIIHLGVAMLENWVSRFPWQLHEHMTPCCPVIHMNGLGEPGVSIAENSWRWIHHVRHKCWNTLHIYQTTRSHTTERHTINNHCL